jgi:hypothetical protein
MTFLHVLLLCAIGLGTGVVGGSLGVGSGIILVPALVYVLNFGQKTAQGMSLLVMAPMVLMAAVRYAVNPSVHVNFPAVLVLAAAAVVGANVGSALAFSLPAEMLRRIFAVFIIAAGLLMLLRR